QADELKQYLKDKYDEGVTLEASLTLAVKALEASTNQKVRAQNLEVAILDRHHPGRKFRRFTAAGLVDLALQAVDGTKVEASASRDRTLDAKGLAQLLERTERAIKKLEAENMTGGDPSPPRLPEALVEQQKLHQQVKATLERVSAEEGARQTNLTDPDAGLLKAPHGRGFVTGYNAQAMVSPLLLGKERSMLITAADVVAEGNDPPQLQSMMAQAGGQEGVTTLADAGYYSAANLQACAQMGQQVLMAAPEDKKRERNPYHKDHFVYCQESRAYRCPKGQTLTFMGTTRHRDGYMVQAYRAPARVCRGCPAFGQCTKDYSGRQLRVGEYEAVHQRHRELMQTPEAKALYRRRKELVEPVFGIIKEQQHGRRFLLRGLGDVRAEWSLLAVGLNLRSLHKAWKARLIGAPGMVMAAA
ncbi:MAG: transposase, partial [Dehalococcoidia bacterium]